MSSVQQFCLRWNNHQPNFISVCSSLLHNGTLVDVTLAAEGRQLQAHRIVLSACSSYFQSLFASNPCQHPIVILKDVHFNDLKTMVDFMYYGEVNVSQEQLPHILKTAEMLKIKGLAEMPDAAASLTKSESKSSSEQAEALQGGGSGSDSLWGSTESQFQHHHHHHQQTQSHHQQRRTPSPTVAGSSPATRRKRLRKSSNSGSAERTSEEQGSIEGSSNINLSQMSQMSFGATASNLAQTIHTKIIKESSSTDTETHPQDSSQESIEDSGSHQHHVQQIKPEVDISGVQQSIPLDISGPGTPSEHEGPSVSCSQSQSSHSGVQWTVVDSNYSRFSLQSCQGNISIGDNNQTSESGNSTTNGQQHEQQNASTSTGNSVVTSNQQNQGHIQMHYQGSSYTPQIISVNSLVSSYSQNLSTPTSPNESSMVQSVYSQGPTPTQSPVHQIASSTANNTTAPNATTQCQQTQVTPAPQKRKRSVNPQGDENFLRALEAVRSGGIGFCKAARLYGVNNRTLWLEYKKRGYPISRPSIKSRIKLEPNISPPPSSTPTNEETTIENYTHINQPTINMQVPPTSETPTPIMCAPHAHPMGVMSFLDTRHMEFSTGIHTLSRQRYSDGAVNVNPTPMNMQDKLIPSTTGVGSKRNRFLIRQHRIKRDSDTMNQQSPEFVDFDPLNTHNLLTVPPKIERHSSEPAPSMTPTSPHLLSVPSGPLLVKQHSHPLLPSQSTSPPSSVMPSFALHRQLSHPTPSSSSAISTSEAILASTGSCTVSTTTFTQNTGNVHFVATSIKQEMEQGGSGPMKTSGAQSPSVILVSDPITTSSSSEHIPTIRVKSEELHRSVSTPQTSSGEMILEPRSSHCPVIRPGPALGCNFCWNTIDAHGRILRRKTKYHCPECQTNLCIVPCFQEYHERQSSDNPSNENTSLSSGKNASATNLRHYPKTGSI